MVYMCYYSVVLNSKKKNRKTKFNQKYTQVCEVQVDKIQARFEKQ